MREGFVDIVFFTGGGGGEGGGGISERVGFCYPAFYNELLSFPFPRPR